MKKTWKTSQAFFRSRKSVAEASPANPLSTQETKTPKFVSSRLNHFFLSRALVDLESFSIKNLCQVCQRSAKRGAAAQPLSSFAFVPQSPFKLILNIINLLSSFRTWSVCLTAESWQFNFISKSFCANFFLSRHHLLSAHYLANGLFIVSVPYCYVARPFLRRGGFSIHRAWDSCQWVVPVFFYYFFAVN